MLNIFWIHSVMLAKHQSFSYLLLCKSHIYILAKSSFFPFYTGVLFSKHAVKASVLSVLIYNVHFLLGLLCAVPQNSMTGVPGVNLISSVTSSLFLNWFYNTGFILLYCQLFLCSLSLTRNLFSVTTLIFPLKSLSNTKGLNTPVF